MTPSDQKIRETKKIRGSAMFPWPQVAAAYAGTAARLCFSETIKISPMQIFTAAAKKAADPCACPRPLSDTAGKMYGAVTDR